MRPPIVRNFSRGFTLIELFVTIAVIVILAGIALPTYTTMQERAWVTHDLNDLRQIGLATQMYLNDNDGVIFSTAPSAGTWMAQLKAKYLPAWKIFQSPFDKRAASESGTASPVSPVSYGLNGNPGSGGGSSIAGLLMAKITNPSAFIVFAPAQTSGTTVAFSGTASQVAPGVTVYKTTSTPGGATTGGTHNSRARINALFADLHSENMLWSVFINDINSSTDPSAAQRWTPYTGY
jgi:prepilin-type N-terminal cleavage/methylation domain-containing protein